MADLQYGTIKGFDRQRGWGFIIPEGGGHDVFVHLDDVLFDETLMRGARVSFRLGTSPRDGRLRAKGVKVLHGEAR